MSAASQIVSSPPASSGHIGDVQPTVCPCCGADEPAMVLEATEFRYAKGEVFQVTCCGRCAHLYLNPRPTEDTLHRYYPQAYYSQLEGQVKSGETSEPRRGRHKASRERRTRAALRQHFGYPGDVPVTCLRKLVTLPTAWRLTHGRRDIGAIAWAGRGDLCDFGCGACGFLRLQRARGWNVCGVDFSEEAANWARSRDNIEVAVGTWPGEALEGSVFDVITGFHVIEHLPDPVGWVQAATAKLRPGGYLLVCCPDADSWAYRFFQRDWFGLDVPRHFSFFTKQRMAQIMTEAGLSVDRIRPQYRASTLRGSAKLRGERTGSLQWKLAAATSLWWRGPAWLTALFGCADGMVVVGRKLHSVGSPR